MGPACEAERAFDVAIVGMACLLPKAPDLETYWRNILGKVDAITEVPADRWDWRGYFDPDPDAPDKVYSRWGGFLDEIPFDPVSYGIPPSSLPSIEPLQLLTLHVVREALSDAGYLDRPFDRRRASVILGVGGGFAELGHRYALRAGLASVFEEVSPEILSGLPEWTADSFAGILHNVAAGRVANRFDLGGVNYTVDAACASSLTAIHLAARELEAGTSDLVIAGGAETVQNPFAYLALSKTQALSPTGRCRTFDEAADGIAIGEGVAVVVLKRVVDAEAGGDRIYAVIKGVGGSSDGRAVGLTAPRPEGQVLALERAYAQAGLSPASVSLIEAHGTGTVAGDQAEVEALRRVFEAAGAPRRGCAIGSVKSMIGHTRRAAGVAAMIKVAKALYHKVLPPTINVERPNERAGFCDSPFYINTDPRPWLAGGELTPRRAGVSAFGFGGTNFHAVLEEYLGSETSGASPMWPSALSDPDDGFYFAPAPAKPLRGGRVAFLFPGQGSQYPNMACELALHFPEVRETFERADRILRGQIPEGLSSYVFPPRAFTPEGKRAAEQKITRTKVAQPALGAASMAMFQLLRRLGLEPDMVAGHSYGEYVALCAAGALSEEDLYLLSEARGRLILEAAEGELGTMAAVREAPGRVGRILDRCRGVWVAAINAPRQTVISGTVEGVARAVERLAAEGILSRPLPVACGFHSPVVAPARERLAVALATVDFKAPALPVFSNTTAAPYARDPVAVAALVSEQLVSQVRFADQVQAMYEAGARFFVEVGPRSVLTGLVGQILENEPHLSVAIDVPGRPGLTQLHVALAELASHGVPLDLDRLHAARASPVGPVGEMSAKPPPPTAWLVNGGRARPLREAGPPRAPQGGGAAQDGSEITRELLSIVAEATGYPPERLDPGLDMEADLGIDSIRRAEILGAFLGARTPSEARRLRSSMERLVRARSLSLLATNIEEILRGRQDPWREETGHPDESLLSTSWTTPLGGLKDPQAFTACLLDRDLLGVDGPIWQRVLVRLLLSPREREAFRNLNGSERRRREWLLGRAVAKDAVRLFLSRRYGTELPPAEIEIARDEQGRPCVEGVWAGRLERRPQVSLSHTDRVTVALAGDDGTCRGVGIDLEHLRPLADGFETAAFTQEETALISSLDGSSSRQEWILRLWCAKEAVGKALGRGLFGHPTSLEVRGCDLSTGKVGVSLSEEVAGKFPEVAGVRIPAHTAREEDLVVASCVTERAP